MRTPPKGDYASLPLTDAATKVADAWDPGERHRGRRAVSRLRSARDHAHARSHPHRWENDTTLKIETEAGTQTRLLNFVAPGQPGAPAQRGEPSWQGTSIANWQTAGGGRRGGAAASRGGSLRVITTNLRPGYLRKNGVPYSANARLTEYINRTSEPSGDSWLVVTTVVEDPQNLTSRFVTSSHFKKVADGSAWSPTPCSAS